ncbi:MAG: hypothetical protein JWP85_904 [Rhodoglobus sp.]|nr:hypothetical protein [Rhodoglobus sp.]
MHPLVFFAIATQERDERRRDDALIWRNARAAAVSPAAVERDSRWAAAISRLSRSSIDAQCCDKAQVTA